MNGKLRNMATVYIKQNGKMLLLYRIGSKIVDPCWCGIGGHFEDKEVNDARAAVLREMNEEIGLNESDLENLDLRYIALRLVKDELRINYYFFADLKENKEITQECDEGILEWVDISEVNDRKMPFTAQYVIDHYLKSGIETDCLYSVSVSDNGLTLTELVQS